MSKMKDKIIGYLEVNTNKNNLFIEIVELTKNVFEGNTIGELNDFNINLNELQKEKVIRLHQKGNEILIGLEANIDDKINEVKHSAIDEMEEELEKCVKVEDYEGAAEWKELIDEGLNK